MDKNLFFQKVRGVAIIAVILGHALDTEIKANYSIIILLRQFIDFAIATFIFLSGYFSKVSALDEKGASLKFIVGKLSRIVLPYLFWSTIAVVFIDKFYGFNLRKIIVNLILGQTVYPYYFIVILAQLFVITPIIAKLLKNKTTRILLFLITPISLIIYYSIVFSSGKYIRFPLYAIPFVMWLGFYCYGILMRNNKNVEKNICKNIKINVALCIVFFAASIMEGFILYDKFDSIDFAVSTVRASSFLFVFFLINIFIWMKSQPRYNKKIILVSIGDYSFGIYLIHAFVLNAVKGITAQLTGQKPFPMHIMFFNAFCTLVICYALIWIVIWISRRLKIDKYTRLILGF